MDRPLRKRDRYSVDARPAASAAALQSEQDLDATLEASFPASDPPSWTLGASNTEATATVHKDVSARSDSAGAQKSASKSHGGHQDRKCCKSACFEFPAWMNEEPLCRDAPGITVLGKRITLPIFPT